MGVLSSSLHLMMLLVVAVSGQQNIKGTKSVDSHGNHNHNQPQQTTADKRILFASCNRQTRNQSFWSSLKALQPDAFLWVGDAVYAKDNSLGKLKVAYDALIRNETPYRDFAHSTKIVGTWDDHDYGVNDGGNMISFRKERKELFLKFIAASNEGDADISNSSSGSSSSSISDGAGGSGDTERTLLSESTAECTSFSKEGEQEQEEQEEEEQEQEEQEEQEQGVYSSFTIGKAPTRVKVLLLDTRFHRDSHWLRSLGEVKWLPLSALVAAALRVVTTFLDVGGSRVHDGDMLGEQQWKWLEKELRSTSSSSEEEEEWGEEGADFHVIVSSVQVFTTNPAVESWGHFPHSKRRLVDLLTRMQPRGLAFLSGDVHHGEVAHPLQAQAQAQALRAEHTAAGAAGAAAAAEPSERSHTDTEPSLPLSQALPLGWDWNWVEVTSSGLTHTCADSLLTRWLCPRMLAAFPRHRLQPSLSSSSSSSSSSSFSSSSSSSSSFSSSSSSSTLPRPSSGVEEDGYFIGKNFGSLETFPGDESNNYTSSLVISVHNLTHLEETLNYDSSSSSGGVESEGQREREREARGRAQKAFASSVVLRQVVYSTPTRDHAATTTTTPATPATPTTNPPTTPPLVTGATHPFVHTDDFPAFPCLWDHLPAGGWRGLALAACHPKSLIAIGIILCIYFQFKCFCLIRGQMQQYAENIMKR